MSDDTLMRHRGFEPRTTWLKVKCSTNWANIPYFFECPVPESNQWHEDFQSSALPTELPRQNCGDRIWTYDLRVMSPTSFQTAPSRDNNYSLQKENGQRWIRTTEAICSRFTVCPLWPLGNPPIMIWNSHHKPMIGLEPITCWLQISCSANWATSAYKWDL